MKKLFYFLSLTLLLILPGTAVLAEKGGVSLSYRGHSADVGWQESFVRDGGIAGTTGKAKQLEALEFKVETLPANTKLEARAHVSNVGWQNWVSGSGTIGTTGQGLAMEALEIKLTTTDGSSPSSDIYYRAHISNFGWLNWAKNGETAGTSGLATPVEAIEIRVVPAGSPAPGATDGHCITENEVSAMKLSFNLTRTGGESLSATGGGTVETSDPNGWFDQVTGSLTNPIIPGSFISYQVFASNVTWAGWNSSGNPSGSVGNQIEAIQFELHGGMENLYDIYYYVRVQDYGWTDWAKNGQYAGSMSGAKPVQALTLTLLPKSQPAPGSCYRSYIDFPVGRYLQGCGVVVSIPDQITMIKDENNRMIFVAACTTGLNATLNETPRGSYRILGKSQNTTLTGPDYVYHVSYWINFIGQEYGFHDSTWRDDSAYGRNVYTYDGSHGCINMRLNDMGRFFNIVRVGDPVVIV